jgi:hypothetical protein
MRRRRQGLQVSTFPFLAVLLCAMGSLILLLLVIDRRAKAVARMKATQTLSRVKEDDARVAAARKVEWERRRRALHALLQQEDEQIVHELHAVEGNARTNEQKTAAKKAEYRALEKALAEELTRLSKGQAALAARRAALGKETGNKQKASEELVRLTEELNLLEQTVRDLKRLHQRDQQTHSLVPYLGKHGDNRKPIYIECAAGRLIFHPQGAVLEGSRVTGRDVLAEVERQIARQRELAMTVAGKKPPLPYLLMLVRPDGITTYFKTLSVLRGMQFDYGYEFVDQSWVLDFSEDGEKRSDWMIAGRPPLPKTEKKDARPLTVRPRGIARRPGQDVFGERSSGGGTQGASANTGPVFDTMRPTSMTEGPRGSTSLMAASSAVSRPGSAGQLLTVGEQDQSGHAQGVSFGTGGSSAAADGPQGPLSVFIGRPTALGNTRLPRGSDSSFPRDPWGPDEGGGSGGENVEIPGSVATAHGGGSPLHGVPLDHGVGASPQQNGSEGARAEAGPARSDDRAAIEITGPSFTGGGTTGRGVEGGAALLTAEPSTPSGAGGLPGRTLNKNAGAVSRGAPTDASAKKMTGSTDDNVNGRPTTATPPHGSGPSTESGFFGGSAEGGRAAGEGQTGAGSSGSASPGSGQGDGQANPGGGQGDGFGSGIVGLAPREGAPVKSGRPMPTSLSKLIGSREWIIPVECRADAVVLRTARLQFPASTLAPSSNGDSLLTQAVAQMIARRQATVRPGDPPYRPVLQLQVQPDGTRTYYLTYPLLQRLGVRMTRKDLEAAESKKTRE